jgi:hypothetical protein
MKYKSRSLKLGNRWILRACACSHAVKRLRPMEGLSSPSPASVMPIADIFVSYTKAIAIGRFG